MQLPDERPATSAGQPHPVPLTDAQAAAEARRIIAREFAPTSYRDETPTPAIGAAPPVAQPGRTPMSQGATDASALMLSGGAAGLLLGGGAAVFMVASGSADPTVCAIFLGAPTVLALAIGRVLKRAKAVVEAAPPVNHHHYEGPVHQDQRQVSSKTIGVIANTRNQADEGR